MYFGQNNIKHIADTPLTRQRCEGLSKPLLVIRLGWVKRNMAENSVGRLGYATSHEAVKVERDSTV